MISAILCPVLGWSRSSKSPDDAQKNVLSKTYDARHLVMLISHSIENDPVEIVDFPIDSMVDLSSSLCDSSPEGNDFIQKRHLVLLIHSKFALGIFKQNKKKAEDTTRQCV